MFVMRPAASPGRVGFCLVVATGDEPGKYAEVARDTV